MNAPGAAAPLGRVGVLGDVHCSHERLQAALALFEREGVERVVCVGDLVDGPGSPNPAIELLDDRGILTVRGNHERWILQEELRDLPYANRLSELSDQAATFIRTLPATAELDTVGGLVLLCHGLADNDMAGVYPEHLPADLTANAPLQELLRSARYSYVINGHTHRRMVRRVGTLTIVNAGTLLESDAPCCVVVDFAAERAHYYSLAQAARPNLEESVALQDAWAEVF